MVVVAVHLLMLAAYTLPSQLVPRKLAVVAMRYARPLYHQQWHLFAPDPPLCSCAVQVGLPSGEWRELVPEPVDPLRKRMARHLAEYVQDEVLLGEVEPIPVLQQAIRSLVRDIGREGGELQFRLVESCVEDPAHPAVRTERITPLIFARP